MITLKDKMEMVEELFAPRPIAKSVGQIDYDTVDGYSRAYYIASRYFREDRNPTADDLRYINSICKTLISVLGTNKKKITFEYVAGIINDPTVVSERWINEYITLLDIVKDNNICLEQKNN